MRKLLKILLLTLFELLVVTSAWCKTPQFLWAKQVSGMLNDAGVFVAADPYDCCIITGSFSKQISFGQGKLTSDGAGVFIIKYDNYGNLAWVKKITSKRSIYSSGVATDSEGNIYVAGGFSGDVDFGSSKLISSGNSDAFIAKYDSNGKLRWSKKGGGQGNERTTAIAACGGGNIIIAGTFEGIAAFGPAELNAFGKTDVFITCYDSQGEVMWIQSCDGKEVRGITAVEKNHLVVVGHFRDEVIFGSETLKSSQMWSDDIFITKYDPNGLVVWSHKAGQKGYDYAYDAAGNELGHVFIAGEISKNVFIAEYDPNGTMVWDREFGSTSFEWARSVATIERDECVVTGFLGDSVTRGTWKSNDSRRDALFVSKYGSSGQLFWMIQLGSSKGCRGTDVATGPDGKIFLVGFFRGKIDFGEDSLVCKAELDAFISCIRESK